MEVFILILVGLYANDSILAASKSHALATDMRHGALIGSIMMNYYLPVKSSSHSGHIGRGRSVG